MLLGPRDPGPTELLLRIWRRSRWKMTAKRSIAQYPLQHAGETPSREKKPWLNLPLYLQHFYPGELPWPLRFILKWHGLGGIFSSFWFFFCFAWMKQASLALPAHHMQMLLSSDPAGVHLQCGHHLCLKCTNQRQVDGAWVFFRAAKKGEPNTNEKYIAPEITFPFYLCAFLGIYIQKEYLQPFLFFLCWILRAKCKACFRWMKSTHYVF